MLAKEGPFDEKPPAIHDLQVINYSYDFSGENWEQVTANAKDLIKRLLCPPEQRLTAEEALSHDWFKQFIPCPDGYQRPQPIIVPMNSDSESED